MDLLKALTNIKSRYTEAKVFSVVFREDKTDRMSLFVCLAYSLEDVFQVFIEQNSKPGEHWLPYMWHFVSLKDMMKASTQTVEVEPQPDIKQVKNDIMKRIIDNKDVGMFEMNKKLFNKEEKAYIKGKLQINE